MKSIEFRINEAGISQNYFWGHHNNQKFIRPKGRAWREHIQWYLRQIMSRAGLQPFPPEARLETKYTFHFRDNRKRDIFNYEKPLTDTFQGFIFKDDNQIDAGHVYRGTEKIDAIDVEISLVEQPDEG